MHMGNVAGHRNKQYVVIIHEKLLWGELWYVRQTRKMTLEGSRVTNISPCFLFPKLPLTSHLQLWNLGLDVDFSFKNAYSQFCSHTPSPLHLLTFCRHFPFYPRGAIPQR